MAKLNQIIAVEKGVKSKAQAERTGLIRRLPILDAAETWQQDPSTDAW